MIVTEIMLFLYRHFIMWLFILPVVLGWVYPVYSTSGLSKVEYESINPDSLFYPIKRGWEKIQLNYFTFGDDAKKKYYQKNT